MRPLLSVLFVFLSIFNVLNAQSGCPGCKVSVPAGLAADTIYLPKIPSGEVGKPYDEDISFRMPKTTTPVHAIDSTTPAGLPISKIEILSLDGLPQGLRWEPNQTVFEVGSQTDGCIKICGKPTQSDTFILMVKIRATVFIVSQESTFPMRLYIAPKVSTTNGFSMANFVNCGKTTVSFKNNIPSKGKSGFSYEWDFGDSSAIFKGENPAAHTYSKPGIYIVKYKAKIDTSPTVLNNISILAVECVDQLGLGQPDVYLYILDPSGVRVFDSSPAINNISLPHTFPIGLTLGAGNYTLEVFDDDAGLKGGDDPCGTVSFNVLSNGNVVSGGFKAVLDIEHTTDEILSQDTVIVYPNPDTPKITAPDGLKTCDVAAQPLILKSDSPADNQWLLSGQPIAGAINSTYLPVKTGYYAVLASNAFGCTALSDSIFVGVYANPAAPIYTYNKNRLIINDTASIPMPAYAVQWFKGNNPIPGETTYRYCASSSGSYGVQVTNVATGCSSYYAATVNYNPAYNCFVAAEEATLETLGIFPNPTGDAVVVRLQNPLSGDATARLWDATGRLVRTAQIANGTVSFPVDCSALANGVFTLEVQSATFRALGKVVVLR